MTRIALSLAVSAALSVGTAEAGVIFTTQSDATQTITSSFGSVTISAFGPQTFDIDIAAGTANVTSLFKGTDFPNLITPGDFWTYDLYNTTTSGTSSQNPDGTYNVTLSVLFELALTSGPLTGLVFETRDLRNFTASNIPSLPFPLGTVFFSPSSVNIFVKGDTSGNPIGTSSARTVTVIPEPASILVFGAAFGLFGSAFARRRRG